MDRSLRRTRCRGRSIVNSGTGSLTSRPSASSSETASFETTAYPSPDPASRDLLVSAYEMRARSKFGLGDRPRSYSTPLGSMVIAAKIGGADPAMNGRLFASVERAKKESVPKDAIQRAINKGAGIGDDKLTLEHVIYEGRAPHNVPVIVEVYTDNVNRTAPEIRVLFKKGQLATTGSNKFLFDHVGLVEAHHPDANIDREEAAIEAGANEVETLAHEQNDDIPEGVAGAKFICDRTAVSAVSKWLSANGWTVVTKDHSISAQWEHTILVTETGHEILTLGPDEQLAYPPGPFPD